MSQDTLASRRCYLVRTELDFVNNGVVAVGWSKVNFSNFPNAEDLIKEVEKVSKIGRRANQIRRFVGMKEGDMVIIPLSRSVAIGFVENNATFYSENYKAKDRANQRHVKFLKDENNKLIKFSRDSFNEGFQRRLRVQGLAVNDITEFQVELNIAVSDANSGKITSLNEKANDVIEKNENDFKKTLLDNIQKGHTKLQAGGVGLEELVKELLEAEGYSARILSKRAFKDRADADIKASKSDRFGSIQLLVQVKHHHGTTGDWGVKQLVKIKNQAEVEYSDHRLVLVTSGRVTDDLKKSAESEGITVFDGKQLVEWIFDKIDVLKGETRAKLGICQVPSIIKYM
jgi:predicted Mrr-cat superfamily restriction endonuclease